jgi:hypothetical protein
MEKNYLCIQSFKEIKKAFNNFVASITTVLASYYLNRVNGQIMGISTFYFILPLTQKIKI